jgi:hypothetical protein
MWGTATALAPPSLQTAVDTEHHLIVAHEVTNVGNDTAHLANTAKAAKAALHVEELEAVADRGYFDGEEILACDRAGITVTLPKRMTSGAKSEGRFGKQDFVYLAEEDVYRCPAGEKLKYYYTNEEKGQKLHEAAGQLVVEVQRHLTRSATLFRYRTIASVASSHRPSFTHPECLLVALLPRTSPSKTRSHSGR